MDDPAGQRAVTAARRLVMRFPLRRLLGLTPAPTPEQVRAQQLEDREARRVKDMLQREAAAQRKANADRQRVREVFERQMAAKQATADWIKSCVERVGFWTPAMGFGDTEPRRPYGRNLRGTTNPMNLVVEKLTTLFQGFRS